MKFKAGDRVWFEGMKYTLIYSGRSSETFPLYIHLDPDNTVYFTEEGKFYEKSPKPVLKLVKKKKRKRIWVDMRSHNGGPWKCVADAYNEGFTEFMEVKK